jgi:3-dehydroquinate synthase
MKLTNRIVTIDRTPVFFGKEAFPAIDRLVGNLHPDGIFIMVDPGTRKHCLPVLMEKTNSLTKAMVIETIGGETGKTLGNVEKIWNELLVSGAGRSGLMINLGGGVVSDLGGFVAAGYQRGMNYINVPTSLMGQADAAIGGKTAVNLGNVKNQVGFFYAAAGVFIVPEFLKTLPEEHLRSGLAEIIKSVLIGNETLWHKLLKHPVGELLQKPVESGLWTDLIVNAVKFKNRVVARDYRERKLRKVLNFGHTIGHALEGLSHMGSGRPLLHGEAVAAGMICAGFLSHQKTGLATTDLDAIVTYLNDGFHSNPVDISSHERLLEIMQHDKKKRSGEIQFTLISKPGHPVINIACDRAEISGALEYYNTINQ